jgi:hypothetical protein
MSAAKVGNQGKLGSAALRVNSQPFAGRLGGNQEFASNESDVLEQTPDAAPLYSWEAVFDLRPFKNRYLWSSALMEGVGTSLVVWLSGVLNIGLVKFGVNTALGPIAPAIFGALSNLIAVPLFIFALGSVSGAHLNPNITIATFSCRLTTFPRIVLYVSHLMIHRSAESCFQFIQRLIECLDILYFKAWAL